MTNGEHQPRQISKRINSVIRGQEAQKNEDDTKTTKKAISEEYTFAIAE